METMQGIFVKRKTKIMSYVIRYFLPLSRFKMARASHVIIPHPDGINCFEAVAQHGVRRVELSVALQGATIVKTINYEVLDANAGYDWLQSQVGKPYDFRGAIGSGLGPNRDWQDDSSWFCFEYFAEGLLKAGRKLFVDNAHITGEMLMGVSPQLR
jgi:hypothetical protein